MQATNGNIRLRTPREHVRQHLREVMKRHKLPSLPMVVTKVLKLLKDPDFSVRELSRIISDDTVLATRTLAVARSANYVQRRQATNVHEAILVLGFHALRNVVMATAAQTFVTGKSRMSERLWSHSLAAALASRLLAHRSRFIDPEVAFVAGLLHDIGEMVLLHGDPGGFESLLEDPGTGQSRIVNERQTYGFDHCAVGAALLDHWNIDDAISNAVLHHHERVNALNPGSLDQIVAMADYVVSRANLGFYSEPPLPSVDARRTFDCEEIPALDDLVRQVREAYEKESVLFRAA